MRTGAYTPGTAQLAWTALVSVTALPLGEVLDRTTRSPDSRSDATVHSSRSGHAAGKRVVQCSSAICMSEPGNARLSSDGGSDVRIAIGNDERATVHVEPTTRRNRSGTDCQAGVMRPD